MLYAVITGTAVYEIQCRCTEAAEELARQVEPECWRVERVAGPEQPCPQLWTWEWQKPHYEFIEHPMRIWDDRHYYRIDQFTFKPLYRLQEERYYERLEELNLDEEGCSRE